MFDSSPKIKVIHLNFFFKQKHLGPIKINYNLWAEIYEENAPVLNAWLEFQKVNIRTQSYKRKFQQNLHYAKFQPFREP